MKRARAMSHASCYSCEAPPAIKPLASAMPECASYITTHHAMSRAHAALHQVLDLDASPQRVAPRVAAPAPAMPIEMEIEVMLAAFRKQARREPLLSPILPNDDAVSVSSNASQLVSSYRSREQTSSVVVEEAVDRAFELQQPESITVMSPPIARTRSGRVAKRRRRP